MEKITISRSAARAIVEAGTEPKHSSIQEPIPVPPDDFEQSLDLRLARVNSPWTQNEAGVWRATANFIVNDRVDASFQFEIFAPLASQAPVVVTGDAPVAEAVPVKRVPSFQERGEPKLTKIEIICKESRFEVLKAKLAEIGITGMTVSHVLGCGAQKGKPEYYRGVQVEVNLLPKVQVDVVVAKVPVSDVIETAKKVLYTGHIGDGKIFVSDVAEVIRIRTGERGSDAV